MKTYHAWEDTLESEGTKVRVYLDNDSDIFNPRTDNENFGKMVCWHRNYNLGDKHNFATSEDFREFLTENPDTLVLPLFLYDHSGITMSTGAFSCQWDSGQVGYIYATPEMILKEYDDAPDARERATKLLESEVETYDQYLTGDVYCYAVEDEHENELDSCCGFFGYDYAKTEAIEAAQRELKRITDKLNAERDNIESFIARNGATGLA